MSSPAIPSSVNCPVPNIQMVMPCHVDQRTEPHRSKHTILHINMQLPSWLHVQHGQACEQKISGEGVLRWYVSLCTWKYIQRLMLGLKIGCTNRDTKGPWAHPLSTEPGVRQRRPTQRTSSRVLSSKVSYLRSKYVLAAYKHKPTQRVHCPCEPNVRYDDKEEARRSFG